MNFKACGLLLVGMVLFGAPIGEPGGGFDVMLPPDKSAYTERFATVAVNVGDTPFESIDIYVDENRTAELLPEAGRGVYCKSVPIKRGHNKLKIVLTTKEGQTSEVTRNVFDISEVFENCEEAPPGYRRVEFHSGDNEKRCADCHAFTPPKKRLALTDDNTSEPDGVVIEIQGERYVIPEDGKKVSCKQCHEPLLSRKNSHAPSVNWLCGECHTGQQGQYQLESGVALHSKYEAPDPVMERCFTCHENKKKNFNNHRSDHGPTKFGRCNICHDPHSSDHEFFLRKSIWTLCTTCHAEKAEGRHVISSFVNGKTHPTRGKPDPARPGRELVCSGCHNPHGSNGVFLLRTDGPLPFSVCKRCHKR